MKTTTAAVASFSDKRTGWLFCETNLRGCLQMQPVKIQYMNVTKYKQWFQYINVKILIE